jgi:hypothetical protein
MVKRRLETVQLLVGGARQAGELTDFLPPNGEPQFPARRLGGFGAAAGSVESGGREPP